MVNIFVKTLLAKHQLQIVRCQAKFDVCCARDPRTESFNIQKKLVTSHSGSRESQTRYFLSTNVSDFPSVCKWGLGLGYPCKPNHFFGVDEAGVFI